MHWFKIGKGVLQGFILSFCLLNFYAMYIMWNTRLEDSQAGIKFARRNINSLLICKRYHSNHRKWRGNKSLLTEVKEESGRTNLKIHILKTKIMASGPIISWQIDGEKVETVTDFIFLGSRIIVDGDCSHEIKRCLFFGGLPWWLSW